MRHAIGIIGRLTTTLMILVALGAAGATSAGTPPALDDDVIAYLAAGGSFADLCGDTTDPSKTSFAHCADCHLGAVAVLGQVTRGVPQVLAGDYTRLVAVAQNIRIAQARDPARLSRAPPQV